MPDSKPLWERLPARSLSSREFAAAIPETYPGDTFAVYAEEPLEHDEYRRVLVKGVSWHYLALGQESTEPVEWERYGHASPDEFPFDPADIVRVAEHFDLPNADEWAQMAYDPDRGEGRRFLAENATMFSYSVLDAEDAADLDERLRVESGLRNGGITAHEAVGRLFSAREPTVSAVENALAHLADALEPLVEAVIEAAKALTDAFSDIVDLAGLEPETAGAVAQAWHETDADVTSPPAHPNARCSTVPMYASYVEFGDLRGEMGRVPDDPSYAKISDVSVTVENNLVTEAAETAMREFAEQAERVAKRRGVRR